jgi:hypothetical protein
MPTLRLEIITAERLVYADDVEIVVAPQVEGQWEAPALLAGWERGLQNTHRWTILSPPRRNAFHPDPMNRKNATIEGGKVWLTSRLE